EDAEHRIAAGDATDGATSEVARRAERSDTRAEVVLAYMPYAIIIAVFVACQITAVKRLLDKATQTVSWPGLHVLDSHGAPLSLIKFTLNWLTTPGTQM